MRRSLHHCLLVLAAFGSAWTPAAAQGVEEADLKAAIVYNILLFVEWPAAVLPDGNGALSLCVGPGSRLREPLKALAGRELRGHPLELRELASPEAGRPCHAVFIDAADRRLAVTLKTHGSAGALVMSDDPESPRDATAIVLQRAGNRIVFDVYLQPLRQARLLLSSKLLRLARGVIE
jgi:hypothetical protein